MPKESKFMLALRKVYPRRFEIALTVSGLFYLKYFAAEAPAENKLTAYRYARLYNAFEQPTTYYKAGVHQLRHWPDMYADPRN